MTKSEIMEILENHDVELYTLKKQIVELKKAMDDELDDAMLFVLPGAVSYDRETVQATPTPQDEKFVQYINVAETIRSQYQASFVQITNRIHAIHSVYNAIQWLDPLGKSVILNLYYPRSSVMDVAQELNKDPKTITRKRDDAIEKLQKYLQKRV